MILYITRHGQVIPNQSNYYGTVDFPAGDPPLTEMGRRQAELLGHRLKESGFDGVIYSSPYYRTMETSEIIAGITGSRIVPASPLREIVKTADAMTGFKGLTMERLRDRFPHADPDALLEYPWWTCHMEESDDVFRRVSPFLDFIIDKKRDALIVGHGASTGAAIRYLFKKYGYETCGKNFGWNCGLTAIRILPDFEMQCLCDVSHLPLEMISSNSKLFVEEG